MSDQLTGSTVDAPDMLLTATKMRCQLLTNNSQMGAFKTDLDAWADHKNEMLKQVMEQHQVSDGARQAMEKFLVAPFSGASLSLQSVSTFVVCCV
jgi:hypothetical protein